MSKRLLAVFAHPDDESFGPGGTLAKYAAQGTEIHLLCVTRGEAGQWHEKKIQNPKSKIQNGKVKIKISEEIELHHVREKELLRSAQVLGIAKVEFLDFIDGTLCNAIYHQLAEKIIKKINKFKPQVLLTADRLGVSGHLDHIAVSMITTYSFLKTRDARKLYYHCLPQKWFDNRLQSYFVYFPEGYKEEEITTRIDYEKYWDQKKKSMLAHKSQIKDVKTLLARFHKWPKVDHFILKYHRGVKVRLPETDFFTGIGG